MQELSKGGETSIVMTLQLEIYSMHLVHMYSADLCQPDTLCIHVCQRRLPSLSELRYDSIACPLQNVCSYAVMQSQTIGMHAMFCVHDRHDAWMGFIFHFAATAW